MSTQPRSRHLSRRAVAGRLATTLAAPLFYMCNGWAEGKSINIGTYTGPQGEYIRRSVVPKFQSDYGCRVFQTESATLGQIAIMRAQKARPTYSVMFMDDVGIPIAKAEDLIVALPRDKLPNLERVMQELVLGDGFAAAFAVSAIAPCYNTERTKPIESYGQLWDPRFHGRMMISTPKLTQSIMLLVAAAALATGEPILKAQYQLDKAWQKMAELKPNVQTVYDSSTAALLQLAQGQFDVAGPEFCKTVLPYTARGAPVDMCYPQEGAFAGINCLTLVKNGPNPDLGAAFIDRMLDPAVQKGLSEATFAAPSIAGLVLSPQTAKLVPYPELKMGAAELFSLDWSYINPRRGAIVERLNQTFGV